MSNELINKVAQSGLITIDLEDFFPKETIIELDIKEFLFRGLILKEQLQFSVLQMLFCHNGLLC
jgi:hypothetical protein